MERFGEYVLDERLGPSERGLVCRATRGDTANLETEHVVGVSLDELLHDIRTDGPPPVEVAISLVAELAVALECSHEQGVVHGNIRPCHLLIARSGSLEVLGFGLVQLEQSADQRCYAAPESTAGDPPDARADLYSLGVVAYELATGRPLFDEHMDPELRSYQGSSIQPPSS